jgi:hypothetical protein
VEMTIEILLIWDTEFAYIQKHNGHLVSYLLHFELF